MLKKAIPKKKCTKTAKKRWKSNSKKEMHKNSRILIEMSKKQQSLFKIMKMLPEIRSKPYYLKKE